MVPGSTLRYGSNFIMFTRKPRLSSRQPIEAAARPLPKLDTTPPVTKTCFADMDATSKVDCWDWTYLVGTIKYGREWKPEKAKNWDEVGVHRRSNKLSIPKSVTYRLVTKGRDRPFWSLTL